MNKIQSELKGHVASCRGLILAFVIGPPKRTPTPSAKHTTEGSSFSCTVRLCLRSVGAGCQPLCFCKGLGNASWMGAQSVCVRTAVFQPGAEQPSPLISSPNAIMVAGAARVSHSGTFSAAHAAVLGLRRNPVDNNVSRLAAETFVFRCACLKYIFKENLLTALGNEFELCLGFSTLSE